jgi:hypothetical protein
MIDIDSLERRMLIAKDIKKEFEYRKHSGDWFWYDRVDIGSLDDYCGPYTTFRDCLCDATDPYLCGLESGEVSDAT